MTKSVKLFLVFKVKNSFQTQQLRRHETLKEILFFGFTPYKKVDFRGALAYSKFSGRNVVKVSI